MAQAKETSDRLAVAVENIGGIASTEVSFDPGVTILAGRNATNRTSFLQAIMAALGSDNVSLKADADRGTVELSVGDETYTRTLRRTPDGIAFDGDPFLEDSELADLFAFLLEDNPARQAVATPNGDLRSVLMEPIDTTAIKAEIQQYEARKRQLDERLEEMGDLEDELPTLTEERTRVESELADKRAELEEISETIEDAEADLEETRQTKDELESKLDEVQSVRSEFESVTDRIETETESIEALREERAELEAQAESLPESAADEREAIEEELASLRSRKSAVERKISELQNLIQFNEDLIAGDTQLYDELAPESGSGNVTDQLVDTETVSCWTCGTEVERTQIEKTVSNLQERREEKLSEVADLNDQIDERKEAKRTIDQRKQEREKIESKLESVGQELEDREETVAELTERRESLNERIDALESEIESLELGGDHGRLLELHQEASRLEVEIDRLESDRESVEAEIEAVEEQLDEREALAEEREEVAETLTDLRTRIERIEKEAIAEFNERIETVLSIMGYENIERIWIERTAADSRGPGETDSDFELHVVRSDESGAAYEDTVEHLSESEREVTGLIFALAGYLVHEVFEEVPFMLLDSVEALDSSRIAKLVEYFQSEADHLVIALLEDDAAALDDQYERVTTI